MSEATTMTDETKMNAAVDYYLEHSVLKGNNGIREVNKKAFYERMENAHGVTRDDAKRFQDAIDYETTVAARVALADTEKKLSEMSADDLANDEMRRAVRSTVRIPTFGGNTEVECQAERSTPNPFRGEGDGPTHTVSHGRFRTTINAKARIDKGMHDEAMTRIRAALKITD